MKTQYPFEVYFDGACPLCRKEIGIYQNMTGADEIAWVDVSEPDALNATSDLSCTVALKRFHVRRTDGTLISGGRAFPELWKHLPRLRWLGLICSVPPVSCLAALAYELLLPIRPSLQRLFGAAD